MATSIPTVNHRLAKIFDPVHGKKSLYIQARKAAGKLEFCGTLAEQWTPEQRMVEGTRAGVYAFETWVEMALVRAKAHGQAWSNKYYVTQRLIRQEGSLLRHPDEDKVVIQSYTAGIYVLRNYLGRITAKSYLWVEQNYIPNHEE